MKKVPFLITLGLNLLFNSWMISQSSVGIQLGSLWMNGDVSAENQLLNSMGFSVQKQISAKSTISLSVSRARSSGFEFSYWSHTSAGGGLEGEIFAAFKDGKKWFPNFVLNSSSLRMNFEYSPFNKNDVGFRKKIIPFLVGGIGIAHHRTNINILDDTGFYYQINEEDRIIPINEIKRKYDDTYETNLPNMNGFFSTASLGFGLNFQVSDIWQVIFSAEALTSFTDNLDGISRTIYGMSSNDQDILYLYQFEIRRNF